MGTALLIIGAGFIAGGVVLLLASAEFDRTKSPGADRLRVWGERCVYAALASILLGVFVK